MLYVPNPRQQARFEQQHTDASKSEGLIFAFFGFAAAYSAFEGPATSSATKRANSAWDSGQLCNVELWALVVCEGSTSSKTFSFVVGVATNCSNSSSSVMSNSARLASVGRIRLGSSSLLICSISEASAVERVRGESLRTFPAKTEQFGRRDIRERKHHHSRIRLLSDAQANHIHENCQHLKL